LTRIKCDGLILGIERYFIENKTLFILMNQPDLNLESLDSRLILKEENLFTKHLWCKDLAFAIDFLHTHNQAHLKIYPQNIFVKNDRLILGEIGFKTQLANYMAKENAEEYSFYYPNKFLNDKGFEDLKSDIR
jgi:serine/threonine protein kinase